MAMPGFTAETSLYKTREHYQVAVDGEFLSGGGTSVLPQLPCYGIVRLRCRPLIARCVPRCGTNVFCYVGCLGITYFRFCRNCIPWTVHGFP
jgi:hypothetical protein